MKSIGASVEKIRATEWYAECRRHSEAFNWPFGIGAVVAILLLLALLATIGGHALV